MANLIKRMLKQDAIYWAPESVGPGGQAIYAEPTQIKCRWEEKSEEFLDLAGNRLVSRAQVFVDRDVELGGVLWLGDFSAVVDVDDADGNPDPFVNKGAWEIRGFGKQPDFKARRFLRWAML